MPNNAILVRYDDAGLSNSIHYKRADIERDLFRALPRERKDHAISVPICEGCFDVEINRLGRAMGYSIILGPNAELILIWIIYSSGCG
jgi:hypothetical protein